MDPKQETPFVTNNPLALPTPSGANSELHLLPIPYSNPLPIPQYGNPLPIPQYSNPLPLCPSMMLTTDSNGMQVFTPVMMPQVFVQAVEFPPLVMMTSSELPQLPLMTSPTSGSFLSSPCEMLDSRNLEMNEVRRDSLDLPPLPFVASSTAGSETSSARSSSPSLQLLDSSDLEILEVPCSDDHESQVKVPVKNDQELSVPDFTKDMTKKDLVNLTLDWLYEVFGSDHFDCEGRRGRNVVRIKVKTRGALEYICPLVQRCIDEELINHVSCPISTKKQKKHIRGYLAYLEAVSEEATARMIEIFNELNTALVENCDGELEHPFKGISRNPIPIRAHGSQIAA